MNDSKIGAMWEKVSKNNTKFLSGEIEIGEEKIKIVAFPRVEKRSEKEPDWDILKSKPLQQ